MIVRSAAKLVSNTLSKPSVLRALTILPVTRVPGGRPKHSPRAPRIAGAVWTTTCFVGSSMAAHTLSIAFRSPIAPTGQTAVH